MALLAFKYLPSSALARQEGCSALGASTLPTMLLCGVFAWLRRPLGIQLL